MNSSVPISFKIAFDFWSGIPNLCDKYLREAASSPSGPPYCEIINLANLGFGHLI